jgi:hypothetical protein
MMQINAAKVLLLFRNSSVSDWTTLNQALVQEFGPYSMIRSVPIIVEQLLQANLLIAENPTNYQIGEIKISDNWVHIQNVFNISLTEMAAVDPTKSMFVQPLFERPPLSHSSRVLDLFVLMPFSVDLKEVYEDHIKNVATNLDLSIARADDFFGTSAVMQDVWTAICKSRLIIADCTGRNPNVFYEIGLAHTVGKPVILITQNKDDVPFDLRHIRYIPYQYTPHDMKKFEVDLGKTIRTELHKLGRQ